jgi:hypothetical protein
VFTGGTSTLAGSVAGNVTINSGATVNALGATVNSTLTNNGTLSVGGGAAGTLTTSSYAQGSTGALNMAIGGLSAGTQYSQFSAGNMVGLGGTLNITFINGFTPSSGNSFKLITYTQESGTFSSITGTTMTPQYNSHDFTLLAALWFDEVPDDDREDGPPAPVERSQLAAAEAAPEPAGSVTTWLVATTPVALAPPAEHAWRDAAFSAWAEEGANEDGGDRVGLRQSPHLAPPLA